MTARQAVRALLLDDRDRVLLLFHSRPHDDDHWAPPGGGIEDGESPEEALARELAEEVGLTGVIPEGPVWLWQHHFSFHGNVIEQHESIYAARVGAWTPRGSPEQQAYDGIQVWRWWLKEDLLKTSEDIWPHGLGRLLPPFLAGGTPVALPIDLGLTTST